MVFDCKKGITISGDLFCKIFTVTKVNNETKNLSHCVIMPYLNFKAFCEKTESICTVSFFCNFSLENAYQKRIKKCTHKGLYMYTYISTNRSPIFL